MGLAGCQSDSSTEQGVSPATEYSQAQQVHHAALDARLGPNGEIDLQLALDLFASVYGVDMQTPTTILPGVAHGHMAVGAILGHWNELTAAQREIVNQAISRGQVAARWDPVTGVVSDATGIELALTPDLARGGKRVDGAEAASGPGIRPYESPPLPLCGTTNGRCRLSAPVMNIVTEIINRYTAPARLGRALRLPIVFAYDDTLHDLATAVGVNLAGRVTLIGERPAACLITLSNRNNFANPSNENLPFAETALAHEMFHCFQIDADNRYSGANTWIHEGAAEWASWKVTTNNPVTRAWWTLWFNTPNTGLFRRTYDGGLGFLHLLSESGINPWTRLDELDAVSLGGDNQAAYNNALGGGSGTDFAARIATSQIRRLTLGADWETRNTGVEGTRNVVTRTIAQGNSVTFSLPKLWPYGTWGAELNVAGDVLSISGGAGVASVGFVGVTTQTVTDGLDDHWCLRSEGCLCPGGAAQPFELHQGTPGLVGVAVAALQAGQLEGSIQVTAYRLEDWCALGPPPLVLPHPCTVVTAADRVSISGDVRSPDIVDFEVRNGPTRCDYVVRNTRTGDEAGGTSFSLYSLPASLNALPPLPDTARALPTVRTLGIQSRIVVWTPESAYPTLSVQVLMPDRRSVIDFTSGASSVASPAFVRDYLERLAALAVSRLTL